MKKVMSLLIVLAMVISMVPAVFAAEAGPVITAHPKNQRVLVNTKAVFAVEAENAVSYQWQYRSPTSEWRNSSATFEGYRSASMIVPATDVRNGFKYRCVVTGANGEQSISKEAGLLLLTRASDSFFQVQPDHQEVRGGTNAVFSVVAEGAVSYQWQYQRNTSNEWKNSSASFEGYNAATMLVPATVARKDFKYRCVVTDASGKKHYSDPALLNLDRANFAFVSHPVDQSVKEGDKVPFTVEAVDGLEYQWQYQSAKSSVWKNSSASFEGYNAATMLVPATAARNGFKYRCIVTDTGAEQHVSEMAVMYVDPFFVEHPVDQVVQKDGSGAFSVLAPRAVSYQWQYQNKDSLIWKDSSATFEGYQSSTMIVPVTSATGTSRDGYKYRCKVTDADGKEFFSEMGTLTLDFFTKHPENQKVAANASATFSVEAEDAVSYQWQYQNKDSLLWKDSSATFEGYQSSTMIVPATSATGASREGYKYRCKVIDSQGVEHFSNMGVLTVGEPVAIVVTEQPANQEVSLREVVSFTVVATGDHLTYQWQVLRQGAADWANILTGTADTLNVVAFEENAGAMYRCVITDMHGATVNTESAQLTIKLATPLEITAQPTAQTAVLGENAEFTVAANGDELKYQWQTNASGEWADIAGATAATLSVVAAEENAGAQYKCVITDKYGETVTSEAAALTVEYPQGHMNNPHLINLKGVPYACETGVVAAGANYYASINNGFAAPNMVIENADVNVIYNGETFKPVDGVVTVPLAPTTRMPNDVQIVNVGTEATAYTLNFSLPVGTMENPLIIEDITSAEAEIAAGNTDGYYMVWTAPEAGLLQLGASSSVWNGEFGVTVDHGNKQYKLPQDANEDGSVAIMVEAGDVLYFTAALLCEYEIDEYWDIVYDEDGNPVVKTEYPAGYVFLSAVYETGTELYPFTISGEYIPGTVTTPNAVKPGASSFYVIGGNGGFTMTVEAENTVIKYQGKEYDPVDGVITVEILAIDWETVFDAVIEIVNNGTEAKAYDLTFAYPVGHMTNPAELVMGETTAEIELGSEGVFYTWTATGDGTLSITMPTGDWFCQINNLTTGSYSGELTSDSSTNPVTIEVAEGDVIQLNVKTYNPAEPWATPAGTIVFNAAFAEENLGDVEIEEDITNPDDGEA